MDHLDAAENFSANLRAALTDRDMSQAELARRADESEMNISRYVRGKCVPPADVAVEIARALGLTVEHLFLPPKKVQKIRQTA